MEKFKYKPSFSYGFIFLLLFGAGAIYYGVTNSFNLAFRRLTILEAPNSSYAVILFGALLVLTGTYSLTKWLAAKGVSGEIALSTQGLSFPVYSLAGAKEKEFLFDDVTELYEKSGEEFSVIVYTKHNHRYEFDATYFENEHTYNAFAGLMNQHCGR